MSKTTSSNRGASHCAGFLWAGKWGEEGNKARRQRLRCSVTCFMSFGVRHCHPEPQRKNPGPEHRRAQEALAKGSLRKGTGLRRVSSGDNSHCPGQNEPRSRRWWTCCV